MHGWSRQADDFHGIPDGIKLRYEDLLAGTVDMGALADYLDMTFDEEVMRDWRRGNEGGARDHGLADEQVDRLLSTLAPQMRKWGYD